MHLWKHMLACIKMQICCSLFWTRVGGSWEVLFPVALLLSAEVGVAPRLLQPADFADDFFFFFFYSFRILRGSYLYRVKVGSTWHPTAPRAVTAENTSPPWRGSGTVALMEEPWGTPGVWQREGLTCAASHRLLSAPTRPCQSLGIHSFMYSGKGGARGGKSAAAGR